MIGFPMKYSGLKSGALAALLCLATVQPALPAQQLDTTQFIVVGEGLAAGMADFQLRDINQTASFPAIMARAFKTAFPMPILQSPGIGGGSPGFAVLPPRLPAQLQGTVRNDFPPDLFVFNLSIPGFKLNDSLNRRPGPPLIQSRDIQQTLTNFILGYPALIAGAHLPLWSQTDYAIEMNPTLAIVELGYYDVLEPAATNNPAGLPNIAMFTTQFASILSKVNTSYPQIIVMTVPDPFDTAYFTPVSSANRLLGAPASVLTSLFGVGANDYLTPNGLTAAGAAITANLAKPAPLSATPNNVVTAATATAVHASVAAINSAILAAAKAVGPNVIVYDLQAYFASLRQTGLTAGTKTLTADYMGGLYSLDGYYPGQTVHAAIANNLLALLNKTYGKTFPTVDLTTVVAGDPAVRFTPSAVRNPISRNPIVRKDVAR
jgi:hypothetical protein